MYQIDPETSVNRPHISAQSHPEMPKLDQVDRTFAVSMKLDKDYGVKEIPI